MTRRVSRPRPGHNAALGERFKADLRHFVVAGAVHFVQEVVRRNNEGGEGAPAAPVDKHELRGSPVVTINQPSTDSPGTPPLPLLLPADVARAVQLGGFSLGDILWVKWLAEHALIIEGGRRRASNGRMIGSPQAPDGWVYPGIESTMSAMDRWKYDGRREFSA